MLSKNNFKERLHQMEPRRERFSIRKLAVGAASVLIGLTFLGITGTQEVHADKGGTANLETEQVGHTTSAKENQGQKQEDVPEQNNEQTVDLKTQNGGGTRGF